MIYLQNESYFISLIFGGLCVIGIVFISLMRVSWQVAGIKEENKKVHKRFIESWKLMNNIVLSKIIKSSVK
jgi:hypothetical protein